MFHSCAINHAALTVFHKCLMSLRTQPLMNTMCLQRKLKKTAKTKQNKKIIDCDLLSNSPGLVWKQSLSKFSYFSTWVICCLLSSPALSPAPGSPAAGHVVLGPSIGRSSAKCCCLSPRQSWTCQMMNARGSNLLPASLATAVPAL